MATTTTDPKAVLSDSKVAGLLDDMFDDCLDTDNDADTLSRGAVYRAMSSTGRRPFDSAWDAMLAAVSASEKERSAVLAGKAKDLRRFKGLVQTQLDATVSCQEVVGRMQVLEDAALDAVLAEVVGAFALVAGPGGTVRGLEGQLADIQRKLQAAERVARDEKVKLAVSAAVTAAGVVMPELSLAGKAAMALSNLALDAALDSALQGREDGKLKSAWDTTDKVATIADGLDKLPKAAGPLMDLVGTAIDLNDAFASEAEAEKVRQQVARFVKDLESARAAFRSAADKLAKIVGTSRGKLTAALKAVASFRATKGSYHAVLKYL